MPDPKTISIIADSREAAGGIPARLARMPGVIVESAQLDSGDFIIAPGVVVERKRDHDFAASILDGRLMPQIKLMKAEFDKVVVLVEGDVHNTSSRIADAALHGALSWLAMLEGVSLIYARDSADSAGLVATMARHLQHGLGYEIALRSGKPKDLRTLQQFLVEGLPGVGPGRAQAIIAHFGSVHAALVATEQELAAVPGLGAKTAQKVHEVLHAQWR